MRSSSRRPLLTALAGGGLALFTPEARAQSLTAQQWLGAPGATSEQWLRSLPPVPAHEVGPRLPSAPVRLGRSLPTEAPRIDPPRDERQQPPRAGPTLRSSLREEPSRLALIRLPERDTLTHLERVKRELGARHARELFYGWYFFELPESSAPTQVRSRLSTLSSELIYVPDEPLDAQVAWNDPLLSPQAHWVSNQWYLSNVGQRTQITGSPYDYDIDADEAWDVTLAAHGRGQFYYSTVAVVDTQVDLHHPDAPEFVGACSLSDTYADASCLPPEGGRSHGTAVAGLIGARSGNGQGMAGVSWANRVLALNVSAASDPEHSFGYYKVINAIDYATRNGAHIINYSGGARYVFQNNDQDPLYAAIHRAADRYILFVTSAGNDNLNLDCGNDSCQVAPAGMALGNIWTVAAVDDQFNRSHFFTEANGTVHASNYGATSVDSAAFGSDAYPGAGSDLVSLVPGGGYGPFNGTSAAAPLVSGVAGLIKSLRPQATPYVYQSCFHYTPAPALNGLVRYPGVINAKAAADCALTFGEQTPPPVFDVSAPAHAARLNSLPYLSWQSAPDFYVNYDVVLDGQFVGRTSGTGWPLASAADGTHRWSIRAVDAYGNWRNSTHEYTFSLDRVAPSAAVPTAPTSGQYLNTARPALRWNAATDAQGISGYQVLVDGVSSGSLGGALGYTWPTALSEGAHSWQVRACDTSQNCSNSFAFQFRVDTVFPTAPRPTSPAHQSTVTQNRPPLVWAASSDQNALRYRVRIDSGAETEVTTTQYTPASALSDGAHTWVVRACDPAGNCTSGVTSAFSVHTSGPNPTAPVLLAPRGGAVSTRRPTFSWSPATDDVGVTAYRLVLDGGAALSVAGTVTRYTSPVDLAEGVHTWSLSACDAEGHCTSSAPASFQLDFQPPPPAAPVSPGEGEEVWESYAYLFQWARASGTSEPVSDVLLVDGQEYAVPSGQQELWLEEFLSEGEHTWSVRSCDAASNCADSPASLFTVRFYLTSARGHDVNVPTRRR